MSYELSVLILTAGSIGFFHTLFGPDHYLPFIMMAQSRKWSLRKTALITFVCGLGHVFSSVLLGIVGIAFGLAVKKLVVFESFRGNMAAWGLIAFGFVYFVWGIKKAIRNKPHQHSHFHSNKTTHEHVHVHNDEHLHVHAQKNTKSITPWVLFTIFIFGPCEPLIPLLMYPAAKESIFGVAMVTAVFSIITIGCMLGVVLVSTFGISFVPVSKLQRYTHMTAGAAIFLCGVSVQFLGL
ncbi:MAG: sulfite exporter TauE/SafE family protein [Planctomycetes bacterium]|nr:sulfite exporter TauE/SafE family protein [Planctomycetota bacterium]